MTDAGFLLDTNVVSEALRPRPEPRVLTWLRAHEGATWLSVLTIGELEAGIQGARDQRRAATLRTWLDEVLVPQFAHRLLSVDLDVARRWGERTAAMRAAGVTVGAVDAQLAATAAHHGLVVATRNVHDFAPFGVDVVDPWSVG